MSGATPFCGYVPLVEVWRGDTLESLHHGALAVADASGHLLAWQGDPEAVTFLRSSAKPLQALPLVESGAADHFALTDPELAVVCASHAGTEAHVATVAGLQRRVGVEEADLQCGAHPPFDRQAAARLREAGREPTPNHHNCSGKHTGMLALARFLGAPLETYLAPQHPVQRHILEAVAAMAGLEPEKVRLGIDGCSAPNFALPLRAVATAYARLADPAGLPERRAEACRRVFRAMTAHPEMVGGPGSFDTALMQAFPGRVLAKGGAEGFQALALPAGALPGQPALGVALKIADGDAARRARSLAALAVLQALGLEAALEQESLAPFGPRPLTNYGGLTVGELRPRVRLSWSDG